MGKHDDIINMDRPKLKRARMPVEDRAKIFAPYAALKGFEESIEERREIHDKDPGDHPVG